MNDPLDKILPRSNPPWNLDSQPELKRRKRSVKGLMTVSFVFSLMLIGWTFSLPFRTSSSLPELPFQQDATQTSWTAAEREDRAHLDDESYVDEAVQAHQFYLYEREQKQAEKRRQMRNQLNAFEIKQQQLAKAEEIRDQIQDFDQVIQDSDAPEGSVFWMERERLKRSLQDLPQ